MSGNVQKHTVAQLVFELDGDEMTHIIWRMIRKR